MILSTLVTRQHDEVETLRAKVCYWMSKPTAEPVFYYFVDETVALGPSSGVHAYTVSSNPMCCLYKTERRPKTELILTYNAVRMLLHTTHVIACEQCVEVRDNLA